MEIDKGLPGTNEPLCTDPMSSIHPYSHQHETIRVCQPCSGPDEQVSHAQDCCNEDAMGYIVSIDMTGQVKAVMSGASSPAMNLATGLLARAA